MAPFIYYIDIITDLKSSNMPISNIQLGNLRNRAERK